jgi:L-asparaginase
VGKIRILTTGGTIAMRENKPGEGAVPTLTGTDLSGLLPAGLPPVDVEEVCNLPGAHMTLDLMWKVRNRALAAVQEADVDGVVVTHGTDTLEETAFLLDLTIPGDKAIVVTGAMRTSSDAGYEGQANLAAAVRVAAEQRARNLGTLVVLNDEIHAARHVTKTHTLAPDTFKSPALGPIGRADPDKIWIAQRAQRKTIPCDALETKVSLIRLAVGMEDEFLRSAIASEARGIVIEGLGGGRIPPWWLPGISKAISRGATVVIATRCLAGRVTDRYGFAGSCKDTRAAGAYFAGGLNGQKARIGLMVALGKGAPETALDALFER